MTIGALIGIIVLILSVVVHEVAHGFVANKLGDPTARLEGRLTLNPIKHIDPVGSILIPGLLMITNAPFLFGWAKPVPYNPYNLRDPNRDEALIAVAGPVSNIILATLGAVLFRVLVMGGEVGLFAEILIPFVIINLVLALFNLVPIPPLDGSKILFSILPVSMYHIRQTLESFGFFIVIAFIVLFGGFIGPAVFSLAELMLGVAI
ncbi:MAG: site-2 protease family protein [Candidatus Campbellbacteria bacterium]|nr:site-2 protease family protein [Candidatus Campbellbacteria bacterium]